MLSRNKYLIHGWTRGNATKFKLSKSFAKALVNLCFDYYNDPISWTMPRKQFDDIMKTAVSREILIKIIEGPKKEIYGFKLNLYAEFKPHRLHNNIAECRIYLTMDEQSIPKNVSAFELKCESYVNDERADRMEASSSVDHAIASFSSQTYNDQLTEDDIRIRCDVESNNIIYNKLHVDSSLKLMLAKPVFDQSDGYGQKRCVIRRNGWELRICQRCDGGRSIEIAPEVHPLAINRGEIEVKYKWKAELYGVIKQGVTTEETISLHREEINTIDCGQNWRTFRIDEFTFRTPNFRTVNSDNVTFHWDTKITNIYSKKGGGINERNGRRLENRQFTYQSLMTRRNAKIPKEIWRKYGFIHGDGDTVLIDSADEC